MAFNLRAAAMVAALVASAGVWLSAQGPQLFQFFVSATDAAGAPVADLRPEDVLMSEDGETQPIIKVEPLGVPTAKTRSPITAPGCVGWWRRCRPTSKSR
jgi:hypothetical protein